MSTKNKLTQYSVDSDTFEQDFAWLDKITVWATLLVVPWFFIYVLAHVLVAYFAGRF